MRNHENIEAQSFGAVLAVVLRDAVYDVSRVKRSIKVKDSNNCRFVHRTRFLHLKGGNSGFGLKCRRFRDQVQIMADDFQGLERAIQVFGGVSRHVTRAE